jgi:Lon protease-like protein
VLSEEFLKSFSGIVPIFPLPNAVLFPGTKMPLHVFEPRYQQMLHDARRSEQLISVALLDRRQKITSDFANRPPIHRIAGLGRLTRIERLPNGLFNIDLFGLSRIRIMEELPTEKPYRLARVETVKEDVSELAETRSAQVLQRAFDAFNKVLRKYSRFPGEFLTRFQSLPIGMLMDIIAHHVPCDAQKKQSFLEETEPLRRCDKIVSALEEIYDGPEPTNKVSALSLFPYPSVN